MASRNPLSATSQVICRLFALLIIGSSATTAVAISEPAADPTPERSLSATYEDGVKRAAEGDLAGAVIQFKNVLQANQNHLPARIALGHANLRLGEAAAAIKELRIALALGGSRDQIFPLLGNALLAQRKYQEILDSITSSDPTSAGTFEISLLRARAFYELGRMQEAYEGYSAAEKLAPTRPEPATGLALVEFANGKNDAALRRLETALTNAPNDVEALYRKGEILRTLPDVDGALAAYDRALDINPQALRVRLARASLLLGIGRLEKALADAQLVADKNPKDISAGFLLWQIHTQARDIKAANDALDNVTRRLAEFKDDAIRDEPLLLRIASLVNFAKRDLVRAESYLKRHAELRPNDQAMRRLLGRVKLLLGDGKSAIESLYPLYQQNPQDTEILLNLGQAYLQTGHYTEAIDVLEQAEKLLPDKGEVAAQLALSRIGLGSREDAIAGLKDTVESGDSRANSAALLLTILQFKNGDREAALSTIESLSRRVPNNAKVLNLKGVMHSALGDVDNAREAFEEAAQRNPDFVPPIFNLAKLDIAQGKTTEGLRRLEAVAERNPRSDAALLALADIALGQQDLAGAAKWLDKAAAAAPDAINTQVRLVELRMALKQTAEALAGARKLVDRNPENSLAVETLAKVQAALEKNDEAKSNFRNATRYASYDGQQLMRIARQQVELADFAEARKTLIKALETGVRDDATAALIRLQIQVGEYADAQSRIDDLYKDVEHRHLANTLLGEMHIRRREYPEALSAFENAQLSKPTAEAVIGIADAHTLRGDYAQAITALEAWRVDHPDDREVARKLAITYLPAGALKPARALHEELLARNREDPVLAANLARIYQLEKDPRARSLAESAYRLAPTWSVALDTLGWILVRDGEVEKGLELLRQAIARQNNPLTRYHVAQALGELGRTTEAKAELKIIIAGGEPTKLVEDAKRYLASLTSES